MTPATLKQWIKLRIAEHPEHKEEMLNYYDLCMNEIEAGESPDNEIYLCISSIEQLIEEGND